MKNRGFGHWQRIDFPIEFPNKIISISAISKRNGVGAAGVNYREDFTKCERKAPKFIYGDIIVI